jgi:hypothetical protein
MRNRFLLTILVVLMTTLLYACGRSDGISQPGAMISSTTTSQASHTTTGLPSQDSVAVYEHYVTPEPLRQSIAQSEIIVIGEVVSTGEIVNTRRDQQDRTKPAQDTFGVGQVYLFRVQRYLKGSGPDVLEVLQREGVILRPQEAVTQVEIEQVRQVSPEYIPFRNGITYLLLLRNRSATYPGNNYYGGAAQIWRFAVSDDSNATPEAPAELLELRPADYAPDPDAPLLPQVEQLIQAEKATTSP